MESSSTITTKETPSLGIDEQIKNMWNKPGSGFAKIMAVLACIGVGIGLYFALPFLISITTNIIILILEVMCLVGILFLFFNKKTHRAISMLWLHCMRKIYGLIVNIDPIMVLKDNIDNLKNKMIIIRNNIIKLEAALINSKNILEKNKSSFEKNIEHKKYLEGLLSNCKDDDDPTKILRIKTQLQLINNEIVRDSSRITHTNKHIELSDKYLAMMKKLEIAGNFKVADAENEFSYKKEEYERAKIQSSIMKEISSIFKGEESYDMMSELALENINNTINTNIAEMNSIIDGSNSIINDNEFEISLNNSKANKILEDFEKNNFDIFK